MYKGSRVKRGGSVRSSAGGAEGQRIGGDQEDARFWPIATDDALTANRRFRGIADMDRFSLRNDL